MLPRFGRAAGRDGVDYLLDRSLGWSPFTHGIRTTIVFCSSFLLPLDQLACSPLLAQDNAPANPFSGGGSILPLFAILAMLFYFMVLRPENKKRADQDRLRKELKKNDRIVTIGGIHGTVVNAPAEGDEITIKLDENSPTRMRVSRAAVQTVLTNKESSD